MKLSFFIYFHLWIVTLGLRHGARGHVTSHWSHEQDSLNHHGASSLSENYSTSVDAFSSPLLVVNEDISTDPASSPTFLHRRTKRDRQRLLDPQLPPSQVNDSELISEALQAYRPSKEYPHRAVNASPWMTVQEESTETQSAHAMTKTQRSTLNQHTLANVNEDNNKNTPSTTNPSEDGTDTKIEMAVIVTGCTVFALLLLYQVIKTLRAFPTSPSPTPVSTSTQTVTVLTGNKTQTRQPTPPSSHPQRLHIESTLLLVMEGTVYVLVLLLALWYLLIQCTAAARTHDFVRILFVASFLGSLFSTATYVFLYLYALYKDLFPHAHTLTALLCPRRCTPVDPESHHTSPRHVSWIRTASRRHMLIVCLLPVLVAYVMAHSYVASAFDRTVVDVIARTRAWLLPVLREDLFRLHKRTALLILALLTAYPLCVLFPALLVMVLSGALPLTSSFPQPLSASQRMTFLRQRAFMLCFIVYHLVLWVALMMYLRSDASTALLVLMNLILKYAYAAVLPAILIAALLDQYCVSVIRQRRVSANDGFLTGGEAFEPVKRANMAFVSRPASRVGSRRGSHVVLAQPVAVMDGGPPPEVFPPEVFPSEVFPSEVFPSEVFPPMPARDIPRWPTSIPVLETVKQDLWALRERLERDPQERFTLEAVDQMMGQLGVLAWRYELQRQKQGRLGSMYTAGIQDVIAELFVVLTSLRMENRIVELRIPEPDVSLDAWLRRLRMEIPHALGLVMDSGQLGPQVPAELYVGLQERLWKIAECIVKAEFSQRERRPMLKALYGMSVEMQQELQGIEWMTPQQREELRTAPSYEAALALLKHTLIPRVLLRLPRLALLRAALSEPKYQSASSGAFFPPALSEAHLRKLGEEKEWMTLIAQQRKEMGVAMAVEIQVVAMRLLRLRIPSKETWGDPTLWPTEADVDDLLRQLSFPQSEEWARFCEKQPLEILASFADETLKAQLETVPSWWQGDLPMEMMAKESAMLLKGAREHLLKFLNKGKEVAGLGVSKSEHEDEEEGDEVEDEGEDDDEGDEGEDDEEEGEESQDEGDEEEGEEEGDDDDDDDDDKGEDGVQVD